MDIKGKTVIVTGAGSGIGAATADYLESQGMVAARWDIQGTDFECDVTSEASVKAALEQTIEKIGRPYLLVNCAGILIGKRMIGREEPADLAHFQKVVMVNLVGSYNVMRLVGFEMVENEPVRESGERGVMINTASIAAFDGQIGQAAYSASKGGVVSMTLPLARELGKFGVRVMAIAPGAVETPMMAGVKDEYREAIESAIPFPSRMAKPDEFAKLVAHIADNEYLNGETIRLDGSARLAAK